MQIQFYRKKNLQTGKDDFYETGTNRYIGPTEFGSGQRFQEQSDQPKSPSIMRDGAGYKMKATGSSLLESFKGQTGFVNTVKDLLQRKQKISQPLTAQKAYWRTMQRDTAAPPKGDILREMSPEQQASIRASRYAAAGAHLQGIREEEEYRGTRTEDITTAITDMMQEKDKLAKSELDKIEQKLDIAKKKAELGLTPTAEDLGLTPGKGIGTRIGGSVSWRHNNPGNIKFGNFAKKYGATNGQKATDGGSFAVFPDLETGQKVMRDLLTGSRYNKLSLEKAMRLWSGGGYGAEVWITGLTEFPMSTSKPTNMMTDEEINSLMQAMVTREGWKEGTILGEDSSDIVYLSRITGLSVTELETLSVGEKELLKKATEEATKGDIKQEITTLDKQELYKELDALIQSEKDKPGYDPITGGIAKIYSLITRLYGTKLSDREIRASMVQNGFEYDVSSNEWIEKI